MTSTSLLSFILTSFFLFYFLCHYLPLYSFHFAVISFFLLSWFLESTQPCPPSDSFHFTLPSFSPWLSITSTVYSSLSHPSLPHPTLSFPVMCVSHLLHYFCSLVPSLWRSNREDATCTSVTGTCQSATPCKYCEYCAWGIPSLLFSSLPLSISTSTIC